MKISNALILALIVIPAISKPVYATPAYTNASNISDMKAREQNIEISLPAGGNPTGCSLPSVFRILATSPNYEVIVSTIVTTISRNKNLSVFVYGCDNDGALLFSAVDVTE